MSRQFNEYMEGVIDLYGTEYRIVEPTSIEEYSQALEVKAALETHISGLMHDEDSSGYLSYLQEQEDYINEYIESLENYDNTLLNKNINFLLKKHNLKISALEQLLQLSAGYISRTMGENSTRKMSIDSVWKIAKVFRINIRDLIETDLSIPNDNTHLVVDFLQRLIEQTDRGDIQWQNLGGAATYMQEAFLDVELFDEKVDGTVIYMPKKHMNPDKTYVLTDDIYVCDAITKDMDLAVVAYNIEGNETSKYYDFVFFYKTNYDGIVGLSWEKAFYSSDDPFGSISMSAEHLVDRIHVKELDADISPEVKNIIADYLA